MVVIKVKYGDDIRRFSSKAPSMHQVREFIMQCHGDIGEYQLSYLGKPVVTDFNLADALQTCDGILKLELGLVSSGLSPSDFVMMSAIPDMAQEDATAPPLEVTETSSAPEETSPPESFETTSSSQESSPEAAQPEQAEESSNSAPDQSSSEEPEPEIVPECSEEPELESIPEGIKDKDQFQLFVALLINSIKQAAFAVQKTSDKIGRDVATGAKTVNTNLHQFGKQVEKTTVKTAVNVNNGFHQFGKNMEQGFCKFGKDVHTAAAKTGQQVHKTQEQFYQQLVKGFFAPKPASNEKWRFTVDATYSPQSDDGTKAVHMGVGCDSCGMLPIVGPRYKCLVCDNFDHCKDCDHADLHITSHPFIKLTSPCDSALVKAKCLATAAPAPQEEQKDQAETETTTTAEDDDETPIVEEQAQTVEQVTVSDAIESEEVQILRQMGFNQRTEVLQHMLDANNNDINATVSELMG